MTIDINVEKNIDTNPSLCIPRIAFQTTKEQISKVFHKLDLGKIDRVDIINKKNPKGEEYKCVFIHFKYWNDSDRICKIKERILSNNDVKIVYEFPWFWKIYLNKWSNNNGSYNK